MYENAMKEFMSVALQALLVIFLPLIVIYVVKLLKAWTETKLAELEERWPGFYSKVEYVAEIAVKAAEQANVAGLIEDRKEYAIETAEKWLKGYGLEIDLDVIDAAIEAAVHDMKQKPEPAE